MATLLFLFAAFLNIFVFSFKAASLGFLFQLKEGGWHKIKLALLGYFVWCGPVITASWCWWLPCASLDPKDFWKPGCEFCRGELGACCSVSHRLVPGSGSRSAGKLL